MLHNCHIHILGNCFVDVVMVIIVTIICGLFNNALSSSDYIVSNDRLINK
jgi:hypothetical protein